LQTLCVFCKERHTISPIETFLSDDHLFTRCVVFCMNVPDEIKGGVVFWHGVTLNHPIILFQLIVVIRQKE
jgi:hypothetical protein